jgi:hypothetical protein
MYRFNDHDGKSKTASEADAWHYPGPDTGSGLSVPNQSDISARGLWLERGQPIDDAEGIWLEAEHELRAAATSPSLLAKVNERAGSVQP